LHSLLLYLKEFIPVARMYLSYYVDTLQSLNIIAHADEKRGERLDHMVHLSGDALEIGRNVSSDSDTLLVENPQEFSFTRYVMKVLDINSSSIIFLVLRSKDKMLGYFVLHSVGEPRFVESNLELVDSLKDPMKIAMSNTLKHREVLKLRDLLADDNRYLHRELRHLSGGDTIIGADFGLRDIMQMVRQVAVLDSPVLLLGETGAGKDVVANAIHYSSTRRDAPFINVNCGAIPETLIDSELFGHERGAFTGALSQKRGRFERADKGTIFLDEIGELPPQAQVRLLKVLQSKEIERVGGTRIIPLDIRIIAATNRDLEAMVKANQFREDLWFRLNVFPIWIPPLRERKSDIPALVQHFIDLKTRELKLPAIPTLAPGAIDRLMEYHWPGNVRELQNVVERALILNPNGPLAFDHLNLTSPIQGSIISEQDREPAKLDEVVSQHIQRVLAIADGKIHGPGGAAELLGVNPSTLRNRMNKLGIEYGRQSKE
jgi:transcriptional regulator with GAF, ATPase, and Fis domain